MIQIIHRLSTFLWDPLCLKERQGGSLPASSPSVCSWDGRRPPAGWAAHSCLKGCAHSPYWRSSSHSWTLSQFLLIIFSHPTDVYHVTGLCQELSEVLPPVMRTAWFCSFKSLHFKLSQNYGKFERRNLSQDSITVIIANICLSRCFCLFWWRGGQTLTEAIKIPKLSWKLMGLGKETSTASWPLWWIAELTRPVRMCCVTAGRSRVPPGLRSTGGSIVRRRVVVSTTGI